MIPWWVWILILLIIILLWILKRVIVVTVAVTVDKTEYYRGEKVKITGSVKRGTIGQSGKAVSQAITPSSGDVYNLPAAMTDSDGNFGISPIIEWTVPADAVDGLHTLTATSLGVSATKTFTRIRRRMV